MNVIVQPRKQSLLILVLAMLVVPGTGWGLTQAWSYHFAGLHIDTTPALADITGDGRQEIIAGTMEGVVLALDVDGNLLWQFEQADVISSPITVAALTASSPTLSALALTNTGALFCLDARTGALQWRHDLPGNVHWGVMSVVAADITGNGNKEVATADARGTLVCLDASGAVVWRHEGATGYAGAPAVADITGDGVPEIIIGGMDCPLICYSHEGRELWRYKDGAATGGAPVLVDLTGDGALEVLVGVDEALAAITRDGALLWRTPLGAAVDSAIATADVTGDGRPEIYVADLSGAFHALNADGAIVGGNTVDGRARRAPAIADLTGDGVPEIVVIGYGRTLCVFDPTGNELDRIALESNANASPVIADLYGDGHLFIICAMHDGYIAAFQMDGLPGGAIHWPTHRADAMRSGRAPDAPKPEDAAMRIVALDTGAGHMGWNKMTVAIDNPEDATVTATLTVYQNGKVFAQKRRHSDKRAFQVSLPYRIEHRAPVSLLFECIAVADGRSARSVREHRDIAPFDAAFASLGASLSALEDAGRDSGADAWIEKERLWIADRVNALRARRETASTGNTAAAEQFAHELRTLMTYAARKAAAVVQRPDTDSALLVTAANPWAPFGGLDELAEGRVDSPAISVEAFQGEREHAALNLFNLSDQPLSVQVTVHDLSQGDNIAAAADIVTVREVVATPTQARDFAADALPAMNQGRVLLIPPLDGRQLFFDIDASRLTPGLWRGTVSLQGLDLERGKVEAPITVEVWTPALPDEQTLRLCHWGYVHRSPLSDQPDEALRDQIDLGTNVFVSLFYPKATFNEAGMLEGAIDFSEHDAFVKRHSPHGLILFYVYDRGLTGPAPQFSESWNRAHVAYLRAWVAHLESLGLDYDDYALYTVDEPGLREGLVARHIQLGTLAREADPAIRLYTDPVGDASLENLKAMADTVDIWCPQRDNLINKPDTGKLDFIRDTGSTVWTYACEDNAKHRSPLGYYRGQSWLAWRHQLTGIGFWTYCATSFDPWFYHGEADYMLVYPGAGIVPSKRSRAIRDGIEDHALLSLLRDQLARAETDGRASEAAARAKDLLGARARHIAAFSGVDDDGELPDIGGFAERRRVEDRRLRAIQTFRRDMAEVFALLQSTER